MSGFHAPHLHLSGVSEPQTESAAESWKRFAAAMLMATAALFLCAVLVVILAPLLPHASRLSHAAGLDLSPVGSHARA